MGFVEVGLGSESLGRHGNLGSRKNSRTEGLERPGKEELVQEGRGHSSLLGTSFFSVVGVSGRTSSLAD